MRAVFLTIFPSMCPDKPVSGSSSISWSMGWLQNLCGRWYEAGSSFLRIERNFVLRAGKGISKGLASR